MKIIFVHYLDQVRGCHKDSKEDAGDFEDGLERHLFMSEWTRWR